LPLEAPDTDGIVAVATTIGVTVLRNLGPASDESPTERLAASFIGAGADLSIDV
jgi:hypothetical protein